MEQPCRADMSFDPTPERMRKNYSPAMYCRRATPTLQSRLRTKSGRRLDRAPEHALENSMSAAQILKRRWMTDDKPPCTTGG